VYKFYGAKKPRRQFAAAEASAEWAFGDENTVIEIGWKGDDDAWKVYYP